MTFFLIAIVIVLVFLIVFYYYENSSSNEIPTLSNNENPINKLTFKESLNLERFNDQLISYNMSKSDEILSHVFNVRPGDGVKMVESVKIVKEYNSIVWELGKEGKKLLKAGKVEWVTHKETGKLLPVVRDAKGKFKQLIKGNKPGKIALTAKAANVVVNAAHIISGADLSKKLDSVNNKLDYLIESRKIDKLSKLESLYYELKELISDSDSNKSREKILEIHDQIRLVRITWRNELEYHLDNIKDPNSRTKFQKWFTFDKSTDGKVYNEITKFEDEMRLIDYCFALDFAICGAVNQDPTALKIELDRFKQTALKLEEKRDYLTGKFPEYNIDDHIKYLSTIPEKYSNFINPELLTDGNED